jgi:bifunctional non-homologous end joining protein LigD
VQAAPDGDQWLHEIKYDGFRMHARLDRGEVRLLTRNGLDWTHKYPAIARAVAALPARQAYLDGELCGVRPDGITSFSMIQMASDAGNAAGLVFFLFDLLYLEGEDLTVRPLIERKALLAGLLPSTSYLHYSDHQIGLGPAFYEKACALGVEGIVSKRADAPYVPGNRGLWLKVKCLNREEFVVIGWTDPEGARPFLGALLLGYYDPGGRLTYAGRVGTGINQAELARLYRRLQPLAIDKMPLDVPPPRSTRFGSPLVLSRVHWVRPELVAEVKFLTWTEDNLLRQVVYEGLRRTSRRPRCGVTCRIRNPERRAARSLRGNRCHAPGAPLSHNQFVALDAETRARRRPGLRIAHRRRARLHNERPQLGEIPAPIVEIGEAIPPQNRCAGPISFAPDRAAKRRPQPGIVFAIFLAANAPVLLPGNGSGQIPLGRITLDRVMAADEFERADKTAFPAAIAQAAFYPPLAITEELQQ